MTDLRAVAFYLLTGHLVFENRHPLDMLLAHRSEAPRTPSAVVEMDPGTWLALAWGDMRWGDALRAGRIRASGERADLSAWLPVAGHR